MPTIGDYDWLGRPRYVETEAEKLENEEKRRKLEQEKKALEALAKTKMLLEQQPEMRQQVDTALGRGPQMPEREDDIAMISRMPRSVQDKLDVSVGNAPIPRTEGSMQDTLDMNKLAQADWKAIAEKQGLMDEFRGSPQVQGFLQTQAAKAPGVVKPEKQAPFDYLASADPESASLFVREQSKDSATGGRSVAALRRKVAEEDPTIAARAQGLIDNLKKNTGVDTYVLDAWQALVDSGDPLAAIESIERRYGATQEGLRGKEEAIPINARNAAATAEAGEVGKGKGATRVNAQSIPGFRPIAGVQISDASAKKVQDVAPDVETMKTLADELIAKYEKMGSVFTGDDAADYSSKVRNLQLLAKSPSLYNLGVLTGPDLRLLEESIPNPASIREGVKKQVMGDLSVKLKNFRSLIDTRANQFYRVNGFEPVGKTGTPGVTTPTPSSTAASKYLEEIRARRQASGGK